MHKVFGDKWVYWGPIGYIYELVAASDVYVRRQFYSSALRAMYSGVAAVGTAVFSPTELQSSLAEVLSASKSFVYENWQQTKEFAMDIFENPQFVKFYLTNDARMLLRMHGRAWEFIKYAATTMNANTIGALYGVAFGTARLPAVVEALAARIRDTPPSWLTEFTSPAEALNMTALPPGALAELNSTLLPALEAAAEQAPYRIPTVFWQMWYQLAYDLSNGAAALPRVNELVQTMNFFQVQQMISSLRASNPELQSSTSSERPLVFEAAMWMMSAATLMQIGHLVWTWARTRRARSLPSPELAPEARHQSKAPSKKKSGKK